MKASELKPGDVLDGWTVTDTVPNATADFWYGDEEDGEFGEVVVVLLTLERVWTLTGHDVNGEEIWEGVITPGQNMGIVGLPTKTTTRRDWYRTDEEVESENKTLGQVAYEALVVGYGENVDAKEWPGLSQATHEAWQAAAEAVVTEAATNSLHQSMQDVLKDGQRQQRERAVTEAAKAWRKNFDFDGGSGAEDEILRDAIDDWLAAEVEE